VFSFLLKRYANVIKIDKKLAVFAGGKCLGMKFVTVAGPPSSGKTSIILQVAACLKDKNFKVGVVKFDCLTSFDQIRYQKAGISVKVGISGKVCPDHFFISNVEGALEWGKTQHLDVLFTESAGLCNRCSPHINGVPGICVIDNLSGIHTPRKIGPMLKLADMVVITKGDIVSQAEREVFRFNVRQVNSQAMILLVNGITGQGAFMLSKRVLESKDISSLLNKRLRFTVPSSVCSYCTGETKIGEQYQVGMFRQVEIV
jgi:Ni2+-binding GTPase involved in maturation of urease and hydrogenase